MAEAEASGATEAAAVEPTNNTIATTTDDAAATAVAEQKTTETEEQPVPEDTPNEQQAASAEDDSKKEAETATDATAESVAKKDPIVSSTKKSRPPYKYDPDKITLRFLFANRDGLTVTIECNPGDTVGEVKAALLSVWPEDITACSGGDSIRLVCMGKGYLMPDSRTLEDCQIPVFKTHPTPINVSIRPQDALADDGKAAKKNKTDTRAAAPSSTAGSGGAAEVDQGCTCNIL